MKDYGVCHHIEEILKEYGDTVYGFAFAKLLNSDDASDVYQTVFLRLFENKPKFTHKTQLRAWLLKTAYNCAMDIFRERSHRSPLNKDIPITDKTDDIDDMLSQLEPKYRDTAYLFYAEGLSVKEIASVLDLKPSGVKSRLLRARQMLEKELKK